MSKTYVIYHNPCWDGFTAAWAAFKRLGRNAEYIPAAHGSAVPALEEGSDVYLVDFTYPEIAMGKIPASCRVQIIDHHKTALPLLGKYPNAIFDMDCSGAYLTWEFFHGKGTAPKLVQYIQDRDLWRWSLDHSREIADWVALFPLTFDAWDEMDYTLTQNFDQAVFHGQIAGQAHKRAVEDILVYNTRCCEHIGGYSVPVANCSKLFGSDTAAALLDLYPNAKFSAYYFDNSEGVREYGLRSRGDFDVSAVAKLYGGGGHANAAGFRVGRKQDLDLRNFDGAIILG